MNADVALGSVLALIGLWFAVYYLWRDFRNDAFRDDIFFLRDRMFLYAAQGNISFGHPAYAILRERMNVLLRHGPDLTLTRFILIVATHKPLTPSLSLVAWETAVNELPTEVQAKMRDFSARVAIFVFIHVMYYSFFRYMAIRPLVFLIPLPKVVESPKVASGVERLESETVERETRLIGRAATA
ncbi:MAG TPA: hypothetical protein VIX17_07165 [Pyrinomonadaceae bacterium]